MWERVHEVGVGRRRQGRREVPLEPGQPRLVDRVTADSLHRLSGTNAPHPPAVALLEPSPGPPGTQAESQSIIPWPWSWGVAEARSLQCLWPPTRQLGTSVLSSWCPLCLWGR